MVCLLKAVLPPLPVMLAAGACLLAGPLVGFWLAGRRRVSWQLAAAAVDRRCGLLDRTLTALCLLGRTHRRPLEALQIEEAAMRLRSVDPAVVVPLTVPRQLVAGLLLFVIAAGLIVWPWPQREEPGRAQAEQRPAPTSRPEPVRARRPAGVDWGWRPAETASLPAAQAETAPLVPLARLATSQNGLPAEGAAEASRRAAAAADWPLAELIPLDRRLTIRRYFEQLRPGKPATTR